MILFVISRYHNRFESLTLIVHYKYFLLKICWGERLPERPTAYLAGDLSAKILKYFEKKKPYSINAKKNYRKVLIKLEVY